jgi:transcriptional regulator with XRE-family HTH domain
VTEFTTVAESVGGNIRAYRQLRGLDQDALARRMWSLGIRWRRVTVSEVEHDRRNVTGPELLWLALALETTVVRLLDPRGPERLKGPGLYLRLLPVPELPEKEAAGEKRTEKGLGVGEYRIQAIPPEGLDALVCGHKARAVAEWDDDGSLKSLHYEHEEQPK